jgi:uncharacterized protein
MDDIQIVSEFKKHVQQVYPKAEIYFYGSRVTRTHREDSDYDLLVILDEVTSNIRNNIYDIAWEIGFRFDVLISPVLTAKQEFLHLTGSPFFNNIKQNGMVI